MYRRTFDSPSDYVDLPTLYLFSLPHLDPPVVAFYVMSGEKNALGGADTGTKLADLIPSIWRWAMKTRTPCFYLRGIPSRKRPLPGLPGLDVRIDPCTSEPAWLAESVAALTNLPPGIYPPDLLGTSQWGVRSRVGLDPESSLHVALYQQATARVGAIVPKTRNWQIRLRDMVSGDVDIVHVSQKKKLREAAAAQDRAIIKLGTVNAGEVFRVR